MHNAVSDIYSALCWACFQEGKLNTLYDIIHCCYNTWFLSQLITRLSKLGSLCQSCAHNKIDQKTWGQLCSGMEKAKSCETSSLPSGSNAQDGSSNEDQDDSESTSDDSGSQSSTVYTASSSKWT